jgi:hypothetical protein
LTQRTCQLCSKLSLALDWLKTLLTQTGRKCLRINTDTYQGTKDRVKEFNASCPDCICEKFLTSKYSPGRISDYEQLSRFVFSPIHVGKKGILPAVFSHTFTVGCSVQRESIVSEPELVHFVKEFLAGKADRSWHGVLTADNKTLRDYTMDNSDQRAFCIYETAEKHNPAHSEIHQARYEIDDADKIELRAKLFTAFNGGVPTVPEAYRNGSILNKI